MYQLPLATRTSRGRPIVNLLPLEADERITAILPTRDYPDDKYIVMATRNGTVKKTPMEAYSRPRSGGIIALNLNDGDELIGVDVTTAGDEVMLFSDAGKVVRFSEEQIRSMGRTATGVRGIRLEQGQRVVSLIVPRTIEEEVPTILTVTENGYGKRTPITDYPAKSRATKGVVSIKVSERNGLVVGAMEVVDTNQIMLISNKGTLVRTRVNEVSVVGRNTQGVRLIRTGADEKVVGMQRIDEVDEDDETDALLNEPVDGEDNNEPLDDDADDAPVDDVTEE